VKLARVFFVLNTVNKIPNPEGAHGQADSVGCWSMVTALGIGQEHERCPGLPEAFFLPA